MTIDLATVTVETFTPLVGTVFVLPVGTFAGYDQAIELTLTAAKPGKIYPGQPADRRLPFVLNFHSAPHLLLEQGTYPLTHPTLGLLEIFIVPLGQTTTETLYEAIFN